MTPGQIYHGDNLEVMRSWPARCVSLVLTSPPYEDCRTYGINFALKGEAWVAWMRPRVVEMCRISDGLVFVNMAGKVRDFSYSGVVELLVADLIRHDGIVCGPAPHVFHRVGIPGSGGPHYQRRDWEPVYAFAMQDRLPPKWSDNTAMGHIPKWAPGGEMSNRQSNGARVNQWGHSIASGATVVDSEGVVRSRGKRPSHRDSMGFTGHGGRGRKANGEAKTPRKTFAEKVESGAKVHTKHDTEADMREQAYLPPPLANPGNVIQEKYTAAEVAALLEISSDVNKHNVGGGQMGSDLAHENEAPFPETLAEFFIRSYCPEGGIVCDPHSGSGTVAKVARKWGRQWVGIDLRDSQVKLSKRRVKEAASLFEGNT